MRLQPASALQKLSFGNVRSALAGYCHTQEAKEQYSTLVPTAETALLHKKLERTAELMTLLSRDVRLPLGQLPALSPLLAQLSAQGSYLTEPELHQLRQMLQTALALREFVQKQAETCPALAELAETCPANKQLLGIIDRVLGADGRMRDDASPELQQLRKAETRTGLRLREQLSRLLQQAKRAGHVPPQTEVAMRNERLVLPLPAGMQGKYPGFVQDVSASGQTVFVEPAASLSLNNELREVQRRIHNEVLRILQQVSAALRLALPDILAMQALTVILDTLQAAAQFGRALQATAQWKLTPAGSPLVLNEARHPLLAFQKGVQAVVPFSLWLDAQERILVISGPNAGGKSILLTAVGLLQVMAQCGLPLPLSPTSTLPNTQQLFVYMGDDQSLHNDLSTYTSHLTNMQQALQLLDAHSLLLIDEFGTGTDPAMGGPLAEALLEAFIRTHCKGMVNTHYSNLKSRAQSTSGLLNGAMSFDPETLSPAYAFIQGKPGSSYAFEIAQRVGIPESVLLRARDLAGKGVAETDHLLSELREQQAVVHALQSKLEAMEADLAARKTAFEAEHQAFVRDKKQTLKDAEKEAARIVKAANAKIEATIRGIKEAQAAQLETRALRKALEEDYLLEPKLKDKLKHQHKFQPQPAQPLFEGASVQMDGEARVGTLVELGERESLVALGELKVRVHNERLVVVAATEKPATKGVRIDSSIRDKQASMQLDVRGMRVEAALQMVDKFLDDLRVAGLQQATILHGKGTGALRNAIRQSLQKQYPQAQIVDAPNEQGGQGVTLLKI